MLGDLADTLLVMMIGYVYPAFECFKAVEMNRKDNQELRFWCKYWIIVALVTVFERLTDPLLSWMPMYEELKLAFFVYLWYPRTKGAGKIYGTFFQTYIGRHETDIDQKLKEFTAKAGDIAVLNWKSFASYAHNLFVAMLQYVLDLSLESKPKQKFDDKVKPLLKDQVHYK